MNKTQINDLTITAMMAALIFCGTFFFKIPAAFGYTHLGDSLLILSICLLGTKKSMYAGAIGAALADLLGGYAVWVLPTLCIKALYAFTMGTIMYKLLKDFKYGWVVGALAGGLLQITLYTLTRVPLYGPEAALISLPGLTTQTVCGIIIGTSLYFFMERVSLTKHLTYRRS